MKEIKELEILSVNNRMLLDIAIGYCKYNMEKSDEIISILYILEIIYNSENKMNNLIDSLYGNMLQKGF